MKPRGRFAVVSLTGGLGNQMFQYAAARALCLRESRQLWLGWGLRRMEKERRFMLDALRLYSLPGVSMLDDEAARWLGLRDSRWRRWFPCSARLEELREPSFSFTPLVGNVDGIVLRGFFQSWRHFSDHRHEIRAELQVDAPAIGRNAERLHEICQTNAVCIHLRRGDYATDARAIAIHGTLGIDYYRAAIEKLGAVTNGATFYVFSDDPGWARTNLRIDKPTCFIDHNRGDEPWEDLRLMAACRHFVIANSTLSWWGAWLSNYSDKRVIAPKRWFASGAFDTKDLCPEEWIRL